MIRKSVARAIGVDGKPSAVPSSLPRDAFVRLPEPNPAPDEEIAATCTAELSDAGEGIRRSEAAATTCVCAAITDATGSDALPEGLDRSNGSRKRAEKSGFI